MTHRSFSLFLLCVHLQSVLSHTDTDLVCIKAYNRTLSNDFLIGEWRVVYLFASYANPTPFDSCSAITFSEYTDQEIEEYRKLYTDITKPYDMRDRPIKYQEVVLKNHADGMVMGSNEVKYFVLKPKSSMVISNGYEAQAYRKINDNFLLFVNCDLRSRVMWLYSRGTAIPSAESLNAVTAAIPEIKYLQKQRYCA